MFKAVFAIGVIIINGFINKNKLPDAKSIKILLYLYFMGYIFCERININTDIIRYVKSKEYAAPDISNNGMRK